MQQAALFLGLIFLTLGISVGLYRIINYKKRIGKVDVPTLNGAPPGTMADKLFYIGTPFLCAGAGVVFVIEAFTGFAG